MLKIAIVEDENEAAERLKKLIKIYAEDKKIDINLKVFNEPVCFLECKSYFDIVFLDIEMPGMNGVNVARRLREYDEEVVIVFVTNLPGFVFNGYEVAALDYILKPINGLRLKTVLNRAMKYVESKAVRDIILKTTGGIKRVTSKAVLYVIAREHLITYVTKDEKIDTWDTLKNVEKQLTEYGFLRCNKSVLVSTEKIDGIRGDDVVIGKESFRISRERKKQFLQAVSECIGK